MTRRRRKKQDPQEDDPPGDFSDVTGRPSGRAQTAKEALMGTPGPFDGPGRLTGWKPTPDGRLVPYRIQLPSHTCACGRAYPTKESLLNHREVEGHGR